MGYFSSSQFMCHTGILFSPTDSHKFAAKIYAYKSFSQHIAEGNRRARPLQGRSASGFAGLAMELLKQAAPQKQTSKAGNKSPA